MKLRTMFASKITAAALTVALAPVFTPAAFANDNDRNDSSRRRQEEKLRESRRFAGRDVVPVKRPGQPWQEENIVNFNHVLRTGLAPNHPNFPEDPDYFIDWKADDLFTRAVETVRRNTFSAVSASPALQKLLAKGKWDLKDREAWEESISTIVSQEIDKIPGLQDYRRINEFVDTKDPRINNISQDMRDGTQIFEFDCEVSSIVEGSVLQMVENHFLPGKARGDNFRMALPYFYASAGTTSSTTGGAIVWHAFIITPAGNIIEGMADPSKNEKPYRRVIVPSSYEAFIRGGPWVTDAYIYGSFTDYRSHRRARESIPRPEPARTPR